ncbi:MAG: helix-turn-helix domain-containing protein [Myxococcales bacterium]|nr:helix-turn-helix domain-containing protein [Myxococcales bacterium]
MNAALVDDPAHLFRDIDKRAAGLADGEVIALYTLLAHRNRRTGQCNPSLLTLADKSGKSKRQLQRIIGGLDRRGIIVRTPGAQHTTTSYEFRLDGLPLVGRIQGGRHGVTPDYSGRLRPEVTVGASRGDTRTLRGDIRGAQGGHLDGPRRSGRENLKRVEDARVHARPESPLSQNGTERDPRGANGVQRRTGVPPSSAPASEIASWCAEWGIPEPAGDAEAARFLDHARSNDRRFADWGAAWRNWQRSAPRFAPGPVRARAPVQPAPPDGRRAWVGGS